jgi:hypothetical protein
MRDPDGHELVSKQAAPDIVAKYGTAYSWLIAQDKELAKLEISLG